MHTLICVTFSLPPGVGDWLRLLLVALPGLFYLPFCNQNTLKPTGSPQNEVITVLQLTTQTWKQCIKPDTNMKILRSRELQSHTKYLRTAKPTGAQGFSTWESFTMNSDVVKRHKIVRFASRSSFLTHSDQKTCIITLKHCNKTQTNVHGKHITHWQPEVKKSRISITKCPVRNKHQAPTNQEPVSRSCLWQN